MGLTKSTNRMMNGAAVSVFDYGAVADAKRATDISVTAGSTTVTAATSTFTADDVGKRIMIWNAGTGNASFRSTISAYVSGTQVTMSGAAIATVSSVEAQWGTDNYQAFVDAVAYMKTATKNKGGVLSASGAMLICSGTDSGDVYVEHNFQLTASDITYDFTGLTLYGTVSIADTADTSNKPTNVVLKGGVFRLLGDNIDATAASTAWNGITCVYGENITITDVEIYPQSGTRSVSIQTDDGTPGAGLGGPQNIYKITLSNFKIIGPTEADPLNPVYAHKIDGIDLMTNGTSDSMWDVVNISNGTIANVARGIYGTAPDYSYSNSNLHLSNIQIIDCYSQGIGLTGVHGLQASNISVRGMRAENLADVNCYGIYLNRCQHTRFSNVDILGNDASLNALTADTTATANVAQSHGFFASVSHGAPDLASFDGITITGAWDIGISATGEQTMWNDVVVAGAVIGINLDGYRNCMSNIVFRDCTTPIDTADAANPKSSWDGVRIFDSTGGTNDEAIPFGLGGDRAVAWATFNGLSGASPIINASYNIDSVTRNGVGDYTITFDNDLEYGNLCMTGNARYYGAYNTVCHYSTGAKTGVDVHVVQIAGATKADSDVVSIAFFAKH